MYVSPEGEISIGTLTDMLRKLGHSGGTVFDEYGKEWTREELLAERKRAKEFEEVVIYER